ncbi:MAG: DUF4097 family beta strand repeat-containing protein [Gemmatimonadota bacterium]
MRPTMRAATSLAVFGLLLAANPGEALAQREIDETRALRANGRVEVENLAGSIEVRGWNRDEVRVTGTLGRNVEDVDIVASGGRVSIRVRHPRRGGSWRSSGTALEISMPAGARLRVETVSSDIDVQGVNGRLDLEAVSGDVDIRGAGGEVRAESVSGTIQVEGTSPDLRLESVSGDVVVSGVDGASIRAGSVSGDVDVRGGTFLDGNFETVSGSVAFTGELADGGDFDFESHSGRVVLVLTGDVNAEFSLSTFSGSIRGRLRDLDISDQVERTSRWTPGREAHFRVGDGSARVDASSFSGSVEIRSR